MNSSSAVDGKRLMVLGIVLLMLGVIAIFAPALAGSAVAIVIDILLLAAGIGQFIQGMQAESGRQKIMLERLAALIPPPRMHRHRYRGARSSLALSGRSHGPGLCPFLVRALNRMALN